MNRLAPFLQYTGKVFALKTLPRGVRSERPFARIPTFPVLVSLVLGVVLRVSSYLELSQQTRRRRWQHRCGLQGPLGDDTLEYVTERLSLEDLRQRLAGINQRLKANKAWERCYHHEPVSMLAQMLILLLGFTLFTAFAQLHNKLVRLGAKALTKELDLALEQDWPWEQWFHSG